MIANSLLGYALGISFLIAMNSDQNSIDIRKMQFKANTQKEAVIWQKQAREKLFELMMGGRKPEKVPLNPKLIKREEVPNENYYLEELTIDSLPDRKVHIWLAMQKDIPKDGLPIVLALHGHGGTAEQIVRGEGLYWYGKAFAQKGYAVISLDLGQHNLQHENWCLMGERIWDALACVDYICTRPEVNKEKIGTAGLSLGGESVMYVAALDERIKIAVSSGWLNTIANMKQGHCPCWNFEGLEENFDFSDIFSLVAPRPLIMEIGKLERAPGGFPVEVAKPAYEEIKKAYKVFGAEDKCLLDIHDGGHIFHGIPAFDWFDKILK
ncbi:MAG: alpha/beta hydrolase family protein [Candidatus Poribacteria bacterium]